MKKFVIIANIGNHGMVNGRYTVSCTVNDVEIITESDDRMELFEKIGVGVTEYRSNGKWYSMSIKKRSEARRILKQFGKL